MLSGAGYVFGKGEKRQQQTEEDVAKLHAKIGQLTMENAGPTACIDIH